MATKTIRTALALAALLALGGCANNPGAFTQPQLESDLATTIKAKSVKLKKQADGSYTGEAIGASGVKYELTVTQDAASRSYWYIGKTEGGPPIAGGKKSY